MNVSPNDKLCLNWKSFQENINSSFRELRSDEDFSDVTLACEDGFQVSGHKVIFASSSPFFKNVLKLNKNPHPLIYMRGVKSEDLVAIVDFLYFGEAEIEQSNLDDFLALAEELNISGLTTKGTATNAKSISFVKEECNEFAENQILKNTTTSDDPWGQDKPDGTKTKVSAEREEKTQLDTGDDNEPSEPEAQVLNDDYEPPREEISFEENDSTGEIDIGTKVRSMMDFSENRVMSLKKPGATMGRARVCKVCGKEGSMAAILAHIENNHIEKVASPCDICGMVSKSRNGLIQHKAKRHSK